LTKIFIEYLPVIFSRKLITKVELTLLHV